MFATIAVTMSLLMSGCAVARKHVSIEVDCDDFCANQHVTDEVRVLADGTVTITLCSNPSTGFQWEPTVCCPLRAVIMAEVDRNFVPPEGTGDMPQCA
jgi:hypothetical protein